MESEPGGMELEAALKRGCATLKRGGCARLRVRPHFAVDFKVLIGDNALNDLREIVDFIAEDDPGAAARLGEKLMAPAMDLANLSNPAGTPSSAQSAETFTYDAAGNRGSLTLNGTSTSYSANTVNQYTKAGSNSLGYDGNGNLSVGLAGSTSWTYDAQNRMVSAVAANGVTMTIAYDALNRPVMRIETTGSAPTFLVYDGWNLVDEYAGNALQYSYLHGAQPDEMLTRTDSGGNAVYYLRDGLGSVKALTDASANVLEIYAYDVYGQPSLQHCGRCAAHWVLEREPVPLHGAGVFARHRRL